MHLGRLAGLGEILLAARQVCLVGRGEAGLGELLLAVGRDLLLGCDESRVTSRTRGGLQPLPLFSFIAATCWFAGLYSFPQAVWEKLGCLTVAGDLLLGAGWLGAADWGRGVPVTVGEVAVSLQGRGAARQAGGAGGYSAGCWAGVSRWVAARPGRGSSCQQLVVAFGEGLQPLPPVL